jgi:hypothetical protein
MHECMLFFWNYVISSLYLKEATLSSASLLPSAKCHKSFSNFLLIADFFWVSSSLILISAYLEVATYIITSTRIVTKDCQCTSSFHVYCLTCSHRDSNPYLVIIP